MAEIENINKENSLKGTNLTVLQFSLLLIITSAVVRMSSSLYLPALIEIGKSLHLSDTILSLTLTIFFVVFAFSTLFAGPCADHFGRKKVIIAGLLFFTTGSLLCAIAESMNLLFAGRILQAMGASCIPVAGRAMIRDICSDIQVMSVLGWMVAIGGLVPILAPMLGGIITETLGWRYNFWILVFSSILAIIIISLKLPRTLPPETDNSLNVFNVLTKYFKMLCAPEFILIITPLALAFSIQGAYLASAPFIFIKHFGLSPVQFGFANLAVVASMLAGRFIATGMTKKFSFYTAYIFGGFLTFAGGSLLGVVHFTKNSSLFTVLITLSIAVTGFGVLLPIAVKSVMTAFKHQAGIASAIHGCLTLGSTALGSFAISVLQKYQISYLDGICYFIIPIGILIFIASSLSRKHLR